MILIWFSSFFYFFVCCLSIYVKCLCVSLYFFLIQANLVRIFSPIYTKNQIVFLNIEMCLMQTPFKNLRMGFEVEISGSPCDTKGTFWLRNNWLRDNHSWLHIISQNVLIFKVTGAKGLDLNLDLNLGNYSQEGCVFHLRCIPSLDKIMIIVVVSFVCIPIVRVYVWVLLHFFLLFDQLL